MYIFEVIYITTSVNKFFEYNQHMGNPRSVEPIKLLPFDWQWEAGITLVSNLIGRNT